MAARAFSLMSLRDTSDIQCQTVASRLLCGLVPPPNAPIFAARSRSFVLPIGSEHPIATLHHRYCSVAHRLSSAKIVSVAFRQWISVLSVRLVFVSVCLAKCNQQSAIHRFGS